MFPLIPLAAVAALGLYKSAAGVIDSSEADKANNSAEEIVSFSVAQGIRARDLTNVVLEDYGSRKLRAFNGCIGQFLDSFGRLKNVEIEETTALDKLHTGDFTANVLKELQNDTDLLMSSGMGLGAGLSGGAAVAFGAYNGTMLLATASTGTAISTLSGVAATNATLAWLGGGSIAAGGGGMALGTIVLGGLVAAPALAIMGWFIGNAGIEALANAKSNLEKAHSFLEDSKKLCEQLQAIRNVATIANSTFSKLSGQLRRSVDSLNKVIVAEGVDYSAYSSESKEVVFRAVKFAQLIKAMIDTPILDESGNLVLSTHKRVLDISVAAVEAPTSTI